MFSQAAEVTTFSSATDLQFEGTVVHALNLAGHDDQADPDLTINGLTFQDARYFANVNNVPNVYYEGVQYDTETEDGLMGASIIANGAPEYGNTAADNSLESLMSRTQSPVGITTVSILGLTPGKTYNLYVLAANNTSTVDQLSRYYLFASGGFLDGEVVDSALDLNLNQTQSSAAGTGVVIHLQGVASDQGALTLAAADSGSYLSGVVVTEAPVAPATVIIGTVDTGVTDATTPCGHLVSEKIAALTYKNHGQYVSAITALLKQLVANGTITQEDSNTIHTIAAQSEIGKK